MSKTACRQELFSNIVHTIFINSRVLEHSHPRYVAVIIAPQNGAMSVLPHQLRHCRIEAL